MPDLKTMNAAGDKNITDGQAWITGKYAGIFTWDSSALSSSQNLPDDAEFVVGDEIKVGRGCQRRFCQRFPWVWLLPRAASILLRLLP